MKALGFAVLGTAAVFLYSGWLGVTPGRLTRDLLTGTPLPTRRPLSGPRSDMETTNTTGGPAITPAATAGTYPLPGGDTVPA